MPDVKIKGYSGAEMEYKAVPKVWLAAPESTEDNPVLVPFTYGETEELTVDLSFPAVESSKVEVFPAQTVEGFYYSNPFGCFVTGITPAPFVPVLGDTYSVEWDGEQFDRTAFEFTAPDGASCIGIGNTIMAGVDSGEPFLVCYDVPNGYFYFFSTQQDASHEIAVYKVEGSGEGSAMVVVPTGEGKIISKVTIPKPDGLVPGNIKKGESVAGIGGAYEGEVPETEEVTVPLNMANGDQVILPSEGKCLAKATVQMPDTLIPENIAEGIDIGGIVGTMKKTGAESRRIEYTLNSNGDIIKAKLINMPSFTGVNSISTLQEIDASESPDITIMDAYSSKACSSLNKITFPPNLTSIGSSVFSGCTSLAEVTIPSKVTDIGTYAFDGCSALRTVTIPASVNYIAYGAFRNCSSLASANFGDASGWYVSTTSGATSGTVITPSNPTTAATWLKDTYRSYYWYDKT